MRGATPAWKIVIEIAQLTAELSEIPQISERAAAIRKRLREMEDEIEGWEECELP